MSDSTGEFEVVQRSRRYLLVAGDDFHGVWDIERDDERAIERFPATDEGLDQAEARFRELRRRDRLRRWAAPRVLGIAVVVGAVLWIVGGIGLSLVYFVEPAFELVQVAAAVSDVGFHLAVGGIVILAALVLVRLGRRVAGPRREALGEPAEEVPVAWPGLPGKVILVLGVTGLAVWVASAVVSPFLPTESVVPPPGSGFVQFLDGERPSRALEIVQAASTAGFRVWVSAFVLLLIGWGRAFLPSRRPRGVGGE